MAAEARGRATPPVAATVATIEAVETAVLTTVVAARSRGSPGRRVVASARPVEVLVAALVEGLPSGPAAAIRVARIPVPGKPRSRVAIAKGRARRVARGAAYPPGPGTALPRQARITQVRGASEARLLTIRRPTLVPLAAVLDARYALGMVTEGQARGPTIMGRRPAGVPGLRPVPARAPADPCVLEGARTGARVAEGVGQVLALGATAVAIEVETAGPTDPAALVQGGLAEGPPTGVAGLVGHARLRRPTGAVEEAARPAAPNTPVPATTVIGATPITVVVVVPFLRLVIREAVAPTVPVGPIPCLGKGPSPRPQDTVAAHAAPAGPARRARVPTRKAMAGVRTAAGALRLLIHFSAWDPLPLTTTSPVVAALATAEELMPELASPPPKQYELEKELEDLRTGVERREVREA